MNTGKDLDFLRSGEWITRGLALARHLHLPPMALVVLDMRGCVVAAGSEAGVGTLRHKIARAKANSALGMGMDTCQFAELIQRGVLSEAFSAALVGQAGGEFNPNPGGVLVREQGIVIGAIGASGATAEEDDNLIRGLLA